MMRSAVVALAVALIAAGAAWVLYSSWPSRVDTYDECMLVEMKGQNQSMYLTAHKVCARRSKQVQELSAESAKFTYRRNQEGRILVEAVKSASESTLTRGEFHFSFKSCSEAKESDFVGPFEVSFENGKSGYLRANVFVEAMTEKAACMKTSKLFGVYK